MEHLDGTPRGVIFLAAPVRPGTGADWSAAVPIVLPLRFQPPVRLRAVRRAH